MSHTRLSAESHGMWNYSNMSLSVSFTRTVAAAMALIQEGHTEATVPGTTWLTGLLKRALQEITISVLATVLPEPRRTTGIYIPAHMSISRGLEVIY